MSTAAAFDSNTKSADPAEAKLSSSAKMRIGMSAAVVVLALATYLIYDAYFFVSTDNATIQARSTLLSSKVGGILLKVDVEENQKVKAGDLIAEIKPDDYVNAQVQMEAERDALVAELAGAEKAYSRTNALLKRGASTPEKFDQAEAMWKSLTGKLKGAQSQVAQAKLNLEYTQIRAPEDGRVGRKSFEVGMLTSIGQPLIGFVAGADRWVVANFKETELSTIKVGQKATIEVDAIPGRKFEGTVESISPTTGATFSLLPPDNATGNFTKVVQRVPVKIKLLNLTEADIDRLQAGLSAEVNVRVR